jgi:AbrB family looped-hinge helix DNA binding protein
MPREILGTSKLSHKFQITIPKDVREELGLDARDIVVFYKEGEKIMLSKNVEP